jgi:hypothetical protein
MRVTKRWLQCVGLVRHVQGPGFVPGQVDVRRSALLDPLPANAVRPPGW